MDRTDASPSAPAHRIGGSMPPPHSKSTTMSSTDVSARFDAPGSDPGGPATGTATAPDLAWKQADHDVFVATREGEFAGFVTVDVQAHIVHDRHSRRIGSYPTLAAARQALADASRPPGRARRRRRGFLSRRR
ncbi:hypothetical protein [Microbacterium sp. NPDC058345]|uniref:hypothetical protein n=1 Tax=Microbacterium sp. NPDC058345 TaxID=3346455 RepID=UPI00364FB398